MCEDSFIQDSFVAEKVFKKTIYIYIIWTIVFDWQQQNNTMNYHNSLTYPTKP